MGRKQVGGEEGFQLGSLISSEDDSKSRDLEGLGKVIPFENLRI